MRDSSRRLRTLLFFYGAAVVVLIAFLLQTMLVEKDTWTQRSYRNRWAFRDVPSRRGSIRDCQGVVLVRDEPTSSLEVHYRSFRRYHPCGVALHCANLVLEIEGEAGRFRFGEEDVRAAFRRCLQLPLSYLRRSEVGRQRARDLRFYASSLYAGLTGGSRSEVGRQLSALLDEARPGRVLDGLGLEKEPLLELFARRLGELEQMSAPLRTDGRDLWRVLGVCEERRLQSERTERITRVVHRRLPYELAQKIAQYREWHPGFFVRPSVDRQQVAGELRWGSLAPIMGRVTLQWAIESDERAREARLKEMAPEFGMMASADADLSDAQRREVEDRLRLTMKSYLEARGRVGRSGVEADMDPILSGTAGIHWLERRRAAREVGLWSSFDVTPGDDVYLSVDLRLQDLLERAVDRALAARPDRVAAIAVVDPQSGGVLALASRPLPRDRIGDDKTKPEPVTTWWSPGDIGSLAKPLILLEHLDAMRHKRPFRQQQEFAACQGRTYMPDIAGPHKRHRLRCDKNHGDHMDDPVYSLGMSCNCFFFQVAEGLGWEGVKNAYRRFGLLWLRGPDEAMPASFQPHVEGLPAAAYPDPAWGRTGDLQRRAIGYQIEANVLQMARAYAGIATGRLPQLCLVQDQGQASDGPRGVDLAMHPDDLAVVREGLAFCASQGTAKELGLVDVWCKTGTAEVGERTHRNNAWLAGYVGGARPRMAFACVVYYVADRGYGAAVAGPMFKFFLDEVRKRPALARRYL